jgi:hypothetical protein
MEQTPLAERIEAGKTRAIEALSVQFSHNALPVDEYERLVEYIHRVESERELWLVEKMVNEIGRNAGVAPERPGREESIPAADLSKFSLTLLSTRTIPGESLCQDEGVSPITILGSTVIDIRRGDLPPGRTVLNLITLLGETEIRVPPGLTVTLKILPVLGNATVRRGVETRRIPGAPELVVTGPVLLGDVLIKLRKD